MPRRTCTLELESKNQSVVAESRFDGGGPGGGLDSKGLIRDKEVRRAVVGGQMKERAGQGKVKRQRGKRQGREKAEAFGGLSFRPGPSPGRCRQLGIAQGHSTSQRSSTWRKQVTESYTGHGEDLEAAEGRPV